MTGPGGASAAPHLNVNVFARGLLRHLVTRVYFSDEEAANATDPVLARVDPSRRATLVARLDAGVMRFDVHLQGAEETVFFAFTDAK
jgi:protocatechuate 3,4-dioxygenase alpha subunit